MNSSETIDIRYIFKLPNGKEETFDVNLDSQTLVLLNKPPDDAPEWANLDFHRCR